MRKRLVILETPYEEGVDKNIAYLRRCLRDSLLRGEAPIAFHGLYTQPGVINQKHPIECIVGIDSGYSWFGVADAIVVYTDLGITKVMEYDITYAVNTGKLVEHRKLYPNEAH